MSTEKKFFTWDIHYSCNYYCTYCFFKDEWKEKSKFNVYPGIDKWVEVWNGIYDKYGSCNIHITGGEPFTYPGIMELVSKLVVNHTIGFDTNLSFSPAEFLAKVTNPEKVSFSSAYHPDFEQLTEYLNKLESLRNAGCKLSGFNFVAYPPVLSKLEEYKNKAKERGLDITVMPYRGFYNDKEYPGAYTPLEKAIVEGKNIADVQDEVSNQDQKEESEVNRPTKDMLEWYGDDNNSREGKMCKMGEVYAKVHPNGNAHRCCMTWENWGLLGNLLDGSFKFYDNPRPCPYAKCSCSSAMIVGQDNKWKEHWQNRVG